MNQFYENILIFSFSPFSSLTLGDDDSLSIHPSQNEEDQFHKEYNLSSQHINQDCIDIDSSKSENNETERNATIPYVETDQTKSSAISIPSNSSNLPFLPAKVRKSTVEAVNAGITVLKQICYEDLLTAAEKYALDNFITVRELINKRALYRISDQLLCEKEQMTTIFTEEALLAYANKKKISVVDASSYTIIAIEKLMSRNVELLFDVFKPILEECLTGCLAIKLDEE